MATIFRSLAQLIHHADIELVTWVPGYGVSETYEKYEQISGNSQRVSFHEEVAYGIAHGAALTGKRATVLMKSHGFAKAANAVIDSLSCGTTAAFLVLVFHDVKGLHSDSILDTRALLRGTGIPFWEVSADSVNEDFQWAIEYSESTELPTALIIHTDLSDQPEGLDANLSVGHTSSYQRDIAQHVLCPVFADYQSQVLAAKHNGMGWREISKPKIPIIPNGLPSRYQKAVMPYLSVMKVFQSIRGDVMCGDTGVSSFFALPPFDCIDVTTYMGGSIPLAIGAMLSGYRNVWAVTGDFAFCAAGHLGLMEAFPRHLPIKILVLNNHKAESTGGQAVPGLFLEMILKAYQPWVRTIFHPDDESEIRMILDEASQAQEMRIVVADYQ